MNRAEYRRAMRSRRRHGRGWTRPTHPHDGREQGGHPQARAANVADLPARAPTDDAHGEELRRSLWRRIFRSDLASDRKRAA